MKQSLNKTDYYRDKLKTIEHWDNFLLKESGLPGKRANLELVRVVADEGNEELFLRYLDYDPQNAPTNSPREFLSLCGVVGIGRLISEGRTQLLELLRNKASDSRWRMRKGVAMALQRIGKKNMAVLLHEMITWQKGSLLEKRAVIAGLCEPALLKDEKVVTHVLDILDHITDFVEKCQDRQNEEFRVLRKGLGYCWSVAVTALPVKGKFKMEKWLVSENKDIRWIMKENLKKNRLRKMDPQWTEKWLVTLGN